MTKNNESSRASSTPPVYLSLGQDPEMISDFIMESHEHLQAIENNLLRLEKDSGDMEAIHATFRAFHTIKGLAGFLDLTVVREVSHEVETLLDRARESDLDITPTVIDTVLESADYLKRWLVTLDAGLHGNDPIDPGDPAPVVGRVRAILALERQPAAAVTEAVSSPTPGLGNLSNAVLGNTVPQNTEAEASAALEDLVVEDLLSDEPEVELPDAPAETEVVEALAPVPAAKSPTAQNEPAAEPTVESGRKAGGQRGNETRSVKVETSKLDHLVDTVGELVIAQSMIQHDPELASLNRPRLVRNLAQLARITNEVQKTAMSMRMVPVGQLFQRMSRLVRDLTRKTGKQAELELQGEDTELDRNLVEELADPLMHMLRNAVDHGVELPEKRLERGKNPVARLRLRASHESGNIVVEVSDDGNGLDRERILAKAVRNGLVSDPASMSDADILNLIFQPGLSTAEQVTDVSGRGVGMDVVRRHVQKLRGRIEIQSVPGKGTSFYLKLPLTLAIVDGLIVAVGAERYIMPLFAVREMLRPAPESIFTVQDKGEMAMVRDRLLPLVRLYRRFGVKPRTEIPSEGLLIVAESATRPFAILVDELLGKQEVVIKSLGPMLHNTPGIAGGAILGDGRVGLIIDLDRMIESSGSGEHGRTDA